MNSLFDHTPQMDGNRPENNRYAALWYRYFYSGSLAHPLPLLACLLAWFSISVAIAEDFSCNETGKTHIWISPLHPKP
ncbi:MAG TPA: hypothetical protein PK714_10230, partial [Nitrosomonas sp.]|nr:hypothetical protein [Nitrosomonas sp.]